MEAKEKALNLELQKKKEFENIFRKQEKENEGIRQSSNLKDQELKNIINEIGKLKFVKKNFDS